MSNIVASPKHSRLIETRTRSTKKGLVNYMSLMLRKLTSDEAAATFANDTRSVAKEIETELVDALADYSVGDAAVVPLDNDTTERAMKVRVTKACKQLGMRAQYAKEQSSDSLTFRLIAPKRSRSRRSS